VPHRIELLLERKLATVTGAGPGSGKAISEVFACAGERSVVTDVDAPSGEFVLFRRV
jgi:NAD(P)-dependent dehydrogenase (short-subunit alcohol dehydrogenase family)